MIPVGAVLIAAWLLAGAAGGAAASEPQPRRLGSGGRLTVSLTDKGRLTVRLAGSQRVLARAALVLWSETGARVEHATFQAVEVAQSDGAVEVRKFQARLDGTDLEGRVRLWPVPGGVVLDYRVDIRHAPAVKELAWSLRLPGDLVVGEGETARLHLAGRPVKVGAVPVRPRLRRADGARSLDLTAGTSSLSVLRESPARLVLRDLRHPRLGRGTEVELLAYAVAAPRPPEEGLVRSDEILATSAATALVRLRRPARFAFAVYVGEKPFAGPPVLIEATNFPARAARYALIESDLRVLAAYRSPFDPDAIDVSALIVTPSGRRETIFGYLTREFSRRVVPGRDGETTPGREELQAAGEAHWRLRYTPREMGRHKAVIRVVTSGGTLERTARFRSVAREDRTGRAALLRRSVGFVRASERDPRFFVDAEGRTFFPVGMNVAWPNSRGTFDYDRIFRQFAAGGISAARVWLTSWWARVEGRRPLAYDIEGAWKIERMLAEAGRRGVAVQLCLDNFHDFTRSRAKSPYFAPRGPCRSGEDFFRLPAAKRLYRHRLRYLVARYGAFGNLLAWELFNEIDAALPAKGRKGRAARANSAGLTAAGRRALLESWTAEMAGYLRQIDPYDHPVTTSLTGGQVWPALCRALDFTPVHGYIPPPARIRDERDFSAARFIRKHVAAGVAGTADGLGDPTRPVVISEFGFAPLSDPGAPTSRANDLDPSGVHLHNAIWAGGLSGAAAAPQAWWWDNYIAANDLAYHYEAFARFIAGEDLAAGRYRTMQTDPDAGDRAGARVIGLHGRRGALLWIQNPANTWQKRVLQDLRPQRISELHLTLSGLDNGKYIVEWWSTYQGKVTTSLVKNVTDHRMVIEAPVFRTDIAVKVRRAVQ